MAAQLTLSPYTAAPPPSPPARNGGFLPLRPGALHHLAGKQQLPWLPSPCFVHLNSADFLLSFLQVGGLPLLLSLRRTPVPAGTRAAGHGTACSWSPLRPELAAAPRPGTAVHARGRAPLLRPRACTPARTRAILFPLPFTKSRCSARRLGNAIDRFPSFRQG